MEGLVFGRRIGKQIAENLEEIKKSFGIKPKIKYYRKSSKKINDPEKLKRKLQMIMTDKVGIMRSRESLSLALNEISSMQKELEGAELTGINAMELKNMVSLANLVVKAALFREESRGAHYRSDFPVSNDKVWLKNIVFGGQS